jgi:glycosyltransferase involved in cell wall biosynthesis
MTSVSPRVSIGIPVYNGAESLAKVLDNCLSQTLPAIEIIISDNGSTDDTAQICQAYASKNPSIRYIRQAETTNPTANYRFVLDQAEGEFFMWAAHDDTRDPEFIERLGKTLRDNPDAVLAFGDAVQYFEDGPLLVPIDFSHTTRGTLGRLYWAATSPLFHVYSLWRTEKLRRIDWTHGEWWLDTPLMMAAELLGDFIHVPGVRLHYLYNEHPFFPAGESVWWKALAGRCCDLLSLVVRSGRTVGKIGGLGLGTAASFFALLKIAQQIGAFFSYRLMPHRGVDRRKAYLLRAQQK